LIDLFRTPWLPSLFLGSIVAVIISVVVMVLRSRRRKTAEVAEAGDLDQEAALQETEEEALADSTSPESSAGLRRSFSAAVGRLRTQGRHALYEIPWFLLLGAEGSRPRNLLNDLGIGLPFGPPADSLPPGGEGCNWWFFDRGVMLDLGGAYLMREGGRTTDDKGWRKVLALLQKHRPQRPVDGVVLTVSCRELLEARRQGASGLADLEKRASLLYRKLALARRKLGIRFPLYVVVTGCDRLPGFGSFCSTVPARMQGDIFGWSSAYNLEMSFHDGWVDEGFEEIDHQLREVQLETLASGVEDADVDELFLFPTTVQALKEPLRVFLAQVVNANAYLGSMLFRGFYFCGTAQPSPASMEGRGASTEALSFESGASSGFKLWDEDVGHSALGRDFQQVGGTRFLKDLLQEKVFHEAALGQPTAGTLMARNRALRVVRIVLIVMAILLGFGLWDAHKKLEGRKETLKVFLVETAELLERQSRTLDRGLGRGRPAIENRATELANRMTAIDASWYGSVFVPSSWFSRFNDQLERSFITAYDQIIFQALFEGLEQKAKVLAEPRSYRGSRPGFGDNEILTATVDIAEMAEFELFKDYVLDLTELESITETYNQLKESQDVKELSRVIEYLFDTTLQEGFTSRTGLYESALRNVAFKRFDLGQYSKSVQKNVRDLSRRFFERLRVTFVEDLRRVADELENLGLPVEEREVVRKARDIQRLVDSITRLESALEGEYADWAFRQDFNLGSDFDGLLGLIDESSLFGPQFADDLGRTAESEWSDYKRDLTQVYQTDLTGPLLKPRDGGRLELSIDVLRLQVALRSLLAFTRVDSPREFKTEVEPGFRLTWETRFLDQAVALDGPYQRFRDREVSELAKEGARPILEAVARITMTAKLIDLLARAQRFEPAPSDTTFRKDFLAKEIETFESANEPLDKILRQLDFFQARRARSELSALMAQQSVGLLQEVEAVLRQEEILEPHKNNLASWDGALASSYAAYGVRDEAQLTFYLDRQRQQLSHLASSYAEPLVKWLQRATLPPEEMRLYRRWSGIITGLEGYENQLAGNPLADLEQEVLEVLPQRSLEECARTSPPGGQLKESEDFFLEQRSKLERRVHDRCRDLATSRAREGYREVEEYFNRQLAGKFPFSAPLTGVFATEAEPDDLRGFYRLFDAHQSFLAGGDLVGEEGRRDEIESFLRQIVEVRKFFAHFLDGEDPRPSPEFDIEVEFRVNQEGERFGNMIIDWDLEVGSQEIDFRDAEKRTRWTVERPVRLQLRWAKDSPWAPVSVEGLPEISADGRFLTYGYSNRWSLLSLLVNHLASRQYLENIADRRPHTLVFEIARRPQAEGQQESLGADFSTRIFVRVTVRVPDSKAPLELPSFPFRAPELLEASEVSSVGATRRSKIGSSR